jgi:hypothetical protein
MKHERKKDKKDIINEARKKKYIYMTEINQRNVGRKSKTMKGTAEEIKGQYK